MNFGFVAKVFSSGKGQEKIVFAVIGFFFLLFLLWFSNWSYDDPYITYRYALNLASGKGFVYNIHQRTLSTTTPFFAVLLALLQLSQLISIPKVAIGLSCVSLSLSSYILWKINSRVGTYLLGWVSLLLFSTFTLPATTISSETPLYIFIGLLTVLLYLEQKWNLAALTSAFLVLTRPDGILLPFLLAFREIYLSKRTLRCLLDQKYMMPVGLFLLISLISWGAIWSYFGSPFPVTLFAKQQQGVMHISQQFLGGFLRLLRGYAWQPHFLLEAMFSLLGLIYLIRNRHPALLVVLWSFLYFCAYTVLRVSRYYWYYAPLVPGFIVLVGGGFQALWDFSILLRGELTKKFFRIVLIGALIFCCVGQLLLLHKTSKSTDQRIPIYRQVGLWLKAYTPANAKVGALEVGAIGFYSQRFMIDFAGLIQPDVAAYMTQSTTYEDTARYAIHQYQPDYVVLHQGVFKNLENELMLNCQKEKIFKGKNFDVDYNMIILQCNWNR